MLGILLDFGEIVIKRTKFVFAPMMLMRMEEKTDLDLVRKV